MSTKTTRLLCAAALAAPLVLVAAPAEATQRPTYRAPEVAWVSDATVHGDRASLVAKYRCYGGNEGTHLWVSLKQGGGITGKTDEELSQLEGTSQLARAWYDTNVVDPTTVTLTCNGRWQVQRYTVGREKDQLRRGTAFMQFCLFDSTADPAGEDLSYGFAYEYRTVRVRTGHHGHHHGHP
jgi:opacity protein-like surface antigen